MILKLYDCILDHSHLASKSNIIHFKVYLFDLLCEDLDHQLNPFHTHYSVSLVRRTRAMAA